MVRQGLLATTIVMSACTGYIASGPVTNEHRSVALDQAELTRVRLRMSAGELEVVGGAPSLLEADFAYNVPEWKPNVTVSGTERESELEVAQGEGPAVLGNTENRWRLALNDSRPIDLNARLGAGQANLRLGSLHLRNLELHVGAGEADVDLRGTPKDSYRVEIRGGVGEATVRLPRSAAISATASGGIGEVDIRGLERRDGRWVNPDASSSAPTIDVDVRGGIGEIRIIAE